MITQALYWSARWICAIPLALVMTLTWTGMWLFDALFGVSEAFKGATEFRELWEMYTYVFTMKLRR